MVTTPSGGQVLLDKGFYTISGLAWSGRGKVKRVDVSTDGGRNWKTARLETPVLSKALTRFNIDWTWDGKPALLQSRAIDETGYVQPAARQLRARVHAWDGRRDAAMALSAPAYAAAPDDYDNAWTQAMAARLGNRPEQALPALDTVLKLKPDAKDSQALAKIVRLPMYSSVSLPLSRYEDSDDIEIATIGPGFATDEDPEHLGERLSLPPDFESVREQVEPNLRPIPDVTQWRP